MEFGTRRSSTWNELGGFNAPVEDTKRSWGEYVRVIPQRRQQERFGYRGTFDQMPERNVLPKPWQDGEVTRWAK